MRRKQGGRTGSKYVAPRHRVAPASCRLSLGRLALGAANVPPAGELRPAGATIRLLEFA
jgi:hypothetical protein